MNELAFVLGGWLVLAAAVVLMAVATVVRRRRRRQRLATPTGRVAPLVVHPGWRDDTVDPLRRGPGPLDPFEEHRAAG